MKENVKFKVKIGTNDFIKELRKINPQPLFPSPSMVIEVIKTAIDRFNKKMELKD